MSQIPRLEKIKDVLNKNKGLLQSEYKVKRLGVFGSYARGDYAQGSDLDILVEFYETPDIFEFIRFEEFLRNLLGIKVELVSTKALKSLIKDEILKETVYI